MRNLARLHPSPPLRRLWLAWFALLGATLVWDVSGLDLTVMQGLADGSGFALRHHWWLEQVLHDAARQLATLAVVALVVKCTVHKLTKQEATEEQVLEVR